VDLRWRETLSGCGVVMTSDAYTWTTSTGGSWGNAANWRDVSTGVSGAAVPGAGNAITVTGPAGASVQQVYGPGQAASALFLNSSVLNGGYAFGSLAIGNSSVVGGVTLNSGASASVAGAGAVHDGALMLASSSQLWVGGTLTLGGSGAAQPYARLNVGDGAHALLGGLQLSSGVTDTVGVDGSGSLEIGAGGQAVAGAVVVDASALLSGAGTVAAGGAIVDSGTILASGGVLTLGAVSGGGALSVAAGAALDLEGGAGAGLSIGLGAGSVLEFGNAMAAPGGTITGFASGDTIIDRSDAVAVSATKVSANLWSLSLLSGGQVESTLTLAGAYDGAMFLATPNGAGGTSTVLGSTRHHGNIARTGHLPTLAAWTSATPFSPA